MRRIGLPAALLSLVLPLAFAASFALPANASSGPPSTAATRPWDQVIVSPPWQAPGAEAGPASCPCTAGTPENEPDCGLDKTGNSFDTTNGGCNFEPFLGTPISCGETVCATTGVTVSGRDTDWYVLTLATESEVTFSITGEFNSIFNTLGIVNSSGGPPSCGDIGTDWWFPLSACVEGSDTRTLSAGEWWFWVGADFGTTLACGTPYTLTVECPLFSDDFESGDVCNWSTLPGASSTCLSCGNHVIELAEECDDGNLSDNDGCSSTCLIDSCADYCGTGTPSGNCMCDPECVTFGDCCYDACTECGACTDPTSCVGNCGSSAPSGCFCDELCDGCGDCCADVCAACGKLSYCTVPLQGASASPPLFGDCRRGAPN